MKTIIFGFIQFPCWIMDGKQIAKFYWYLGPVELPLRLTTNILLALVIADNLPIDRSWLFLLAYIMYGFIDLVRSCLAIYLARNLIPIPGVKIIVLVCSVILTICGWGMLTGSWIEMNFRSLIVFLTIAFGVLFCWFTCGCTSPDQQDRKDYHYLHYFGSGIYQGQKAFWGFLFVWISHITGVAGKEIVTGYFYSFVPSGLLRAKVLMTCINTSGYSKTIERFLRWFNAIEVLLSFLDNFTWLYVGEMINSSEIEITVPVIFVSLNIIWSILLWCLVWHLIRPARKHRNPVRVEVQVGI